MRLAKDGAALRRQLLKDHEAESARDLQIVETACQAYDQALAAEALVARAGLVITGPRGSKAHPAIAIAANARQRMLRALRQL